MKKRLIDKETGKVVREWNTRDESILLSQQKNPHIIFRNKKKYTRKQKHKKPEDEV